MGDRSIARSDYAVTFSGTRLYPYFLHRLLGTYSLEYLAHPRYNMEDLAPSPKQCTLLSLRSKYGGGVSKYVEELGGKEGEGTDIGM